MKNMQRIAENAQWSRISVMQPIRFKKKHFFIYVNIDPEKQAMLESEKEPSM